MRQELIHQAVQKRKATSDTDGNLKALLTSSESESSSDPACGAELDDAVGWVSVEGGLDTDCSSAVAEGAAAEFSNGLCNKTPQV